MSTITRKEIDNLDTRFSMRMFIADLPRVLNETFSLIKTIINKIYNAETNELKANSIDVGTVKASTIITNSIAFKSNITGDTIKYDEIQEMKNAIERIKEELNIHE